jgi:hypothetical protein
LRYTSPGDLFRVQHGRFAPRGVEERWRRSLRLADTTHVGWKTDPVKDDRGRAPILRSRPGTDLRLEGQGPGTARSHEDQKRAAKAVTNLPRSRSARVWGWAGWRQRLLAPRPTADPRDKGPSRSRVSRRAVVFFSAVRAAVLLCQPLLVSEIMPKLGPSYRVRTPTPISSRD